MAIVEMSKIRLLGLSYNKDAILDALNKTGSVEVVESKDLENTFKKTDPEKKGECQKKYERIKSAVSFIENQVLKAKGKEYFPKNFKGEGERFIISYQDFFKIAEREKEIEKDVLYFEGLSDKLLTHKSEIAKLNTLYKQLKPYENADIVFSSVKNGKNVQFMLGTIKSEKLQTIKEYIEEHPLISYEILSALEESVVLFACHESELNGFSAKLNETGFVRSTFDYDITAKEKISEIKSKLKEIEREDEEVIKSVALGFGKLKDIKILTDYYRFQNEKNEISETFSCTDSTFMLEGYLPKEKEEFVYSEIEKITKAVFIEFSEPSEDEVPPTLLKNGKLVSQTEFVTEMYSLPNYREFDPNKIVFFFFMIFMGLIMADVGYGVLMITFGLILSSKIKIQNGAKKLWNIIAIGGVFTVIFGVVFNSFFGFNLLPFNIIKGPTTKNASGTIDTELIMIYIMACLGLGVFQIAVGYLCKAINSFRKGKIIDGLCDGIVWVLFFIGLIGATFNFLFGFLGVDLPETLTGFFDKVSTPCLYVVIGTIVIAALTAGRKEKGFGKFSKGFGAVYGLISIMSDILSYSRIFGLMLSGMIIANTFNDMGLGLMLGGGVGLVLGGLVILVGHAFNLAMNVLGAYIHDSRLQYIEFFGKFYEGEGEPFIPLGSKNDYVYLVG